MNTRLEAPLEITTNRLRLRKPRLEDAGRLFEPYANDSEVTRYLIWMPHRSVDETKDYLSCCLDEWQCGAGYPYVIEFHDRPTRPVGMIHLHTRPYGADFGYLIARPHWGHGYASEALTRLVEWSLDQPNVWRAAAVCDGDNLASARVMEKSGMAFEGILRRFIVHPNISPEPRDCRMYGKVRP